MAASLSGSVMRYALYSRTVDLIDIWANENGRTQICVIPGTHTKRRLVSQFMCAVIIQFMAYIVSQYGDWMYKYSGRNF